MGYEAKVYTTSQLATKLGLGVSETYALVRFLVTAKLATSLGPAPKEPGVKRKGKGETRYELLAEAPKAVCAMLEKALT